MKKSFYFTFPRFNVLFACEHLKSANYGINSLSGDLPGE